MPALPALSLPLLLLAPDVWLRDEFRLLLHLRHPVDVVRLWVPPPLWLLPRVVPPLQLSPRLSRHVRERLLAHLAPRLSVAV